MTGALIGQADGLANPHLASTTNNNFNINKHSILQCYLDVPNPASPPPPAQICALELVATAVNWLGAINAPWSPATQWPRCSDFNEPFNQHLSRGSLRWLRIASISSRETLQHIPHRRVIPLASTGRRHLPLVQRNGDPRQRQALGLQLGDDRLRLHSPLASLFVLWSAGYQMWQTLASPWAEEIGWVLAYQWLPKCRVRH